MKSVGVRELKDKLSTYLAVVRRGGEVVVTERRRAIARLAPVQGKSSHERLAELVANGEVTLAARRTRSLPKPMRLPRSARVSDLVKEQRR